MSLLIQTPGKSRSPSWQRDLTLLILAATTLGLSVAAGATTIGPDAHGYTATDDVAFAFEDISATGSRVLANADDNFVTIPLGFTFQFYGNSYTALSVNPNGLITFGAGSQQYSNIDLSTTSPDIDVPSIAVLWDDWQFTEAGADALYYQTLGSPGTHRFVAMWRIAHGFSSSPSDVTFAVTLHEASDTILMQHLDVDSGDLRSFGADATVGIRDGNGHGNGRQLQWSYLSGVITNGQAIRFGTCNHDGALDAFEECDDNNSLTGDGCNLGCRIEECYSCAGAPSVCSPTASGSACASSADTDCTSPDACDGAGNCLANDTPADTPCADEGNDCTRNLCDGAGACIHPPETVDTPCGSQSSTDCDYPDSCDGAGTCYENFVTPGAACGDPSDTECTHPDTCNEMGICVANHEPPGSACADSADSECTDPDACDANGTCQSNSQPDGMPCSGGNGNTCLNACAAGVCSAASVPNCCGNGTLEAGERCDDGNQLSGDECDAVCHLVLDNFQCYRTRILEEHPAPPVSILVNQFHTINAAVGKPQGICNPAAADSDHPTAPSHPDHLEDYRIRTEPRRDIVALLPIRDIKVVDRFGTLYVDAVRPKGLLVPTAKDLSSVPIAPLSPAADHFTCYKVKRAAGRPRFVAVPNIAIDDQFGALAARVVKPSRLCLPTNKYNEEPGAETHLTHLMCYTMRAQFSTPGRVFTANPFGAGVLYVKYPSELCVPAVKNPS